MSKWFTGRKFLSILIFALVFQSFQSAQAASLNGVCSRLDFVSPYPLKEPQAGNYEIYQLQITETCSKDALSVSVAFAYMNELINMLQPIPANYSSITLSLLKANSVRTFTLTLSGDDYQRLSKKVYLEILEDDPKNPNSLSIMQSVALVNFGPAPTPSSSSSKNASTAVSKTKKITCIKGKTTAVISGLNPKCPAGFKQK